MSVCEEAVGELAEKRSISLSVLRAARTALMAAAVIVPIPAIYIEARVHEHHSPIEVPASSRPLNWPNNNARAFLISKVLERQSNCGQVSTFLHSLYDASEQTTPQYVNVREYVRDIYEMKGQHTYSDAAEARAIQQIDANPATQEVMICLAGPDVPVRYGGSVR